MRCCCTRCLPTAETRLEKGCSERCVMDAHLLYLCQHVLNVHLLRDAMCRHSTVDEEAVTRSDDTAQLGLRARAKARATTTAVRSWPLMTKRGGSFSCHTAANSMYSVDLDLLTSLIDKGVPLDYGVAKLGERICTLCSRRLGILVIHSMQCLCS